MKKIWRYILLLLLMCLALAMPVLAQETENLPEDWEEMPLIPDTGEIPENRQKPRLLDDADLLSDTEEKELAESLDEVSLRQGCDVNVLTVNSLNGMTAEAFADDYFDYNGLGIGENKDGILLLVSMGERKWAISTHGYAIDVFTDSRLDSMEDEFKPYLSDGDYEEAFYAFVNEADNFLTIENDGETADSEEAGLLGIIIAAVICVIPGLLIGRIYSKCMLKMYSGVINHTEAMTRLCSTNLALSRDDVVLVGRGVQRTYNPPPDDDDDSTTHFGSSGEIHGGSSGDF